MHPNSELPTQNDDPGDGSDADSDASLPDAEEFVGADGIEFMMFSPTMVERAERVPADQLFGDWERVVK